MDRKETWPRDSSSAGAPIRRSSATIAPPSPRCSAGPCNSGRLQVCSPGGSSGGLGRRGPRLGRSWRHPAATAPARSGRLRPAAVWARPEAPPCAELLRAVLRPGVSLDGLSTTHALTRSVCDTALLARRDRPAARPEDPFPAPPPARPFVEEALRHAGPPARCSPRTAAVPRHARPAHPGRGRPRGPDARGSGASRHVRGAVMRSRGPAPGDLRHSCGGQCRHLHLAARRVGAPAGTRLARPGDLGHAQRGARVERARSHLGDRRPSRSDAAARARILLGLTSSFA